MIGHILGGWLFWQSIKIKYAINYSKALIVLSNENHELDKQILLHLTDFTKRKHVDCAVILCVEECVSEWTLFLSGYNCVHIDTMSEADMERLYDYYSFMKFFDNIVFTYTDKPEDNLLGTYLRETAVNEEDAACLALYHLRSVPKARR